MPRIDVLRESSIAKSTRTQQLSAMFDVPAQERSRFELAMDLPIEEQEWQIGLIVGPSGCGKTTIARQLWPDNVDPPLQWGNGSVVDSFDRNLSMETIAEACMAVGFNTIPSWLRPFDVLSNGEKFRVELARRLIEGGDFVVIDEFTSVVDRQVAKIAAHAAQKFVRRRKQKLVCVTCHYDVVEWLQPDWILDPSQQQFARGSLRRRPSLDVAISPVPYSAWRVFAPFHYLTKELHRAARCFALFLEGRMAAFAGMLYRPGTHKERIMGCSRLVTLPDFQGLGLAFALIDTVASIYKGVGMHTHTYPAHPALIRGFDKSTKWAMRKKPGTFSPPKGDKSTIGGDMGGRPCAVFRYAGDALERTEAERILSYWKE
jgi:ABC-type lipoprotein export system ATPase subunit